NDTKERTVFPFLLSDEPEPIKTIDGNESAYKEVTEMLFDEISSYLTKEDSVFPEKRIFLHPRSAKENDTLIQFREKFSALLGNSDFGSELAIIEVFRKRERND